MSADGDESLLPWRCSFCVTWVLSRQHNTVSSGRLTDLQAVRDAAGQLITSHSLFWLHSNTISMSCSLKTCARSPLTLRVHRLSEVWKNRRCMRSQCAALTPTNTTFVEAEVERHFFFHFIDICTMVHCTTSCTVVPFVQWKQLNQSFKLIKSILFSFFFLSTFFNEYFVYNKWKLFYLYLGLIMCSQASQNYSGLSQLYKKAKLNVCIPY